MPRRANASAMTMYVSRSLGGEGRSLSWYQTQVEYSVGYCVDGPLEDRRASHPPPCASMYALVFGVRSACWRIGSEAFMAREAVSVDVSRRRRRKGSRNIAALSRLRKCAMRRRRHQAASSKMMPAVPGIAAVAALTKIRERRRTDTVLDRERLRTARAERPALFGRRHDCESRSDGRAPPSSSCLKHPPIWLRRIICKAVRHAPWNARDRTAFDWFL